MIKNKLDAFFIRHPDDTEKMDRKICFRKKLMSGNTAESVSISIWADSRYYLWVNGDFIGTGPSRNWPQYPERDVYEITFSIPADEIQIAVLVWHFGTSTSQYIHGPLNLAVLGLITDKNKQVWSFGTDRDWHCAVHTGYLSPVPRINVSQGFIEVFDESLFSADWTSPEFNDSSWLNVATAAPPESIDRKPYTVDSMPERSIALLKTVIRKPEKIVSQRAVSCVGTGVRIDYKEAFYPNDRTTEDLLQTGYICCVLESPAEQMLTLTLADRLWPETEEYVLLNGEKIIADPGVRTLVLNLKRGQNLFMLDVSGARQRFTADLHFKTKQKLKFCSPLHELGSVFIAVGPFEFHRIGNIVCADGFPLDFNKPIFLNAGKCRTAEELSAFIEYIHPIGNVHFDGAKLRTVGADFLSVRNVPACPRDTIILEASTAADHEVILDMGVEVSGFLRFSLDAEAAAELDFNFFEYIVGDKPEIPDDLDLSMRYRTPGGRTSFRSLNRRGFRYVLIRLRSAGRVRLTEFIVDETLYPLANRGSFQASDRELDNIWKICRRTVELCSEDTLIDSPAFEQAFWTGDAYVMALYHQYLFGETELIRHSLLLAAHSMHFSELPDCHLPAGVHLLLTAWAQLWMTAVENYWMFTADEDFLKEIYPWLSRAALAFLNYIDQRGLLKIDAWNMLDWADMDTPYRGTVAHLNARQVECFRVMSRISGILGLKKEELRWADEAEKLAEKADSAFWNDETNCYLDCIHNDGSCSDVISVQTNLMMMQYGCVPETRSDAVKSFILNPPAGAVTPGSPFLAHFYYDYLFSEGLGKEALAGIREQWGPMLSHGTCWETFIGFYKDRLTRSYCHAWSAAPAFLFGARVLGLQPLSPGFAKILIAPVPSGLKKAEGCVPTPSGDAFISWTAEPGCFRLNAVLPPGTEWEFIPPEGWEDSYETDIQFSTAPEGL